MNRIVLAIVIICTLFTACTANSDSEENKPETQTMPAQTAEQYDKVDKLLDELSGLLNADFSGLSSSDIARIKSMNDQLVFTYNPIGMDSASVVQCERLKNRTTFTHNKINYKLQDLCRTKEVVVCQKEQTVMSEPFDVPVYLENGDMLKYRINAERGVDVRVYNVDSHQLVKTYSARRQIMDSLSIAYKGVYLIRVSVKERQYVDLSVGYMAGSVDRLSKPRSVKTKTVDAQKGDFLSYSVKGIKMKNLFEEPKKFTLRGQLKAAFSGSYRAIVAVQVPAGASDILYSLRISTNEGDKNSDGKFYDNMDVTYKRIKVLGLPLYESHGGSGLIATLLGDNMPVREEDAYINMYVFYNSSQAKKFQDGLDPAKLSYNIDYSTMGTQSCNGRIPAKGCSTIYLGFLNERMRYNNYVWLEAVSAVPHTEYFKPEYKVY